MAAHGIADRRQVGGHPSVAEREDRAGDGLGVQGLERPAGGHHAVDHHRGQRLAGGGLERGLPAGIDLDQVEQGAEHAVDGGQPLGPRRRAGLVQRERQRFGPGPPRVQVGLGGAVGGLGLGQRRLGVGSPLLGPVERLDQRQLGRLGRGDVGAQALGVLGQAGGLVGEHVEPGPHAGHLALAPLGALAQRGQLAPHLRGPPARGGHAVGPLELEAVALGGQRRLGLGQLERLGLEQRSLGLGLGELGLQSGGLGLERGDDALVDEGAAVAVDAASALGQQRRRGPGPSRTATRTGPASRPGRHRPWP